MTKRFDLIFHAIALKLKSHPIRDLKLSRQEEVDQKNGVHYSGKSTIFDQQDFGEQVLEEKKP
jgi:hypothetical protein